MSRVDFSPRTLNEWGALGGVIGRIAGNYWAVPVIEGIEGVAEIGSAQAFRRGDGELRLDRDVSSRRPSRRKPALERRGAPVAAPSVTRDDVTRCKNPIVPTERSTSSCSRRRSSASTSCATWPAMCDGRRFTVPLLAVTSPQVKPDADRLGFTATDRDAGGTCSPGMCFYQSYAREIAEANGWKRLATNSAKLVNILGGYGYRPMLASMEACVDAAVSGRLQRWQSRDFVHGTPWAVRSVDPRSSPTTDFRHAMTSTALPACSHGRRTSWSVSSTSAEYWCSIPRKAALRPHGCCTR